MKGKIIYIIIGLILIGTTYTTTGLTEVKSSNPLISPPDVQWTQIIGGAFNDWGNAVIQTSDGGYAIAGTYDRELWFPWIAYFYLLKTDPSGACEWEVKLGDYNSYEAHSLIETSDGCIVVAGQTGYSNPMDAYVIKVDSSGNLLWEKTYGGSDYDAAFHIQETSDGGFIFVGNTKSYGYGERDVYLVKIDEDGNEIWTKTYGGIDYDEGWEVQQTSDGGYIILANTLSFGEGGRDIYLIKTNETGNLTWSKTFGGFYYDEGWGIDQTSDGGYIIVGDTFTYSPDGTMDLWVLKTDDLGDELWNTTFGGDDLDFGNTIHETADSGFIIAGSTSSFSGTYLYNMYIVKTDSNGVEDWSKTIGDGSCDTEATDIKPTDDNGYIVVGYEWPLSQDDMDIVLVKIEGDSQPPEIPTITGPTEGNINIEYEYTVTTTDPEGDDIFYYIDWGDDTNSGWIGPYTSGDNVVVSKTWTQYGTFDVIVKAKDGYEAMSGWSNPLTVLIFENNPPEAPDITGAENGKAGEPYEYTFLSTDPDDDEIYYTIEWGDNENETYGPYSSGETLNVEHTWFEQGTYLIKAKAKDVHGFESDWATLEITMPVCQNKIGDKLLNLFMQIFERFQILQKLASFFL